MKLKITKTYTGYMDTSLERKRIDEAFKDTPKVRAKLHEFMDAFEAMDWTKAEKLMDSKWWKGYDTKEGCPRKEYLGLSDIRDENGKICGGFDVWLNYEDIVWALLYRPKNYKMETIT